MVGVFCTVRNSEAASKKAEVRGMFWGECSPLNYLHMRAGLISVGTCGQELTI